MRISSALLTALNLFIPCIAMADASISKTIDTPDGTITATKTTVAPTLQTITIASLKDIQTFNSRALEAEHFVTTYLPKVVKPSLKDFDEAFHLWQKEKNRRYTEQQVIEMLGAYLGNKAIVDFQMEWVVVTDEYGTDYAVRAKKYEVMSFPFSSVAKRIEKNQYDFMVGVYYTLKTTITDGEYKTR